MYGFTSQIRRAFVHQFRQILPKVAEERVLPSLRASFNIAMGSASETEYLIFLAHDLKYLNTHQYTELMDTIIGVKKMLTALLKKLRT